MPKPHEHDSIAVTNIDINCDKITSYTVEKSVPVEPTPGEVNPLGIPKHQTQQIAGEFNHSDYFEVRYNGQPFRIVPGDTKVFPRYLAEHFAKHLADHILQEREHVEKRVGLVQSSTERPKVLNQILEVRQFFLEGQADDTASNTQVDIPGMQTSDLGEIPNYAMGNLKPEPKTAEEILAGAGEHSTSKGSVVDNLPPEPPTTQATAALNADLPADLPNSPVTDEVTPEAPDLPQERSKSDLIREAVELGIDVTGREKVDELKQKIAAF